MSSAILALSSGFLSSESQAERQKDKAAKNDKKVFEFINQLNEQPFIRFGMGINGYFTTLATLI